MAPRVVFDTNVLLSSLFSLTGPPFRCLALARTGAVESVTCQAVLEEFIEKLVDKFGFERERAHQAADEVRGISELVTVTGPISRSDNDLLVDAQRVCLYSRQRQIDLNPVVSV